MRRLLDGMRRVTPAGLATFVVVATCVGFTVAQLHPELILRDTTPAGGDMGAHVWGPAYLRDHLLPSGRLSGWTPDWYAGFPALFFYFPLPALAIVIADLVLPYGVAFKLVSVSGVATLPISVWAFGRLAGFRFPGPAVLAVATVPFLFDRSFSIYGGNIASTLAGEFAFSMSLSLGFVFLGVFAHGLRTGRHRALAAVLLAVTGVTHVIPVFFFLVAALLMLVLHLDRDRLRWAAPVFVVGGLLAAFWVMPFLLRLPYTNDMGWEKLTSYRKQLLPFTSPCAETCGTDQFARSVTNGFKWASVLALAGAVAALGLRRRSAILLVGLAAASAAGFVLMPQGRLWNARLLPFWFLSVYLLAGYAFSEAARLSARLIVRARGGVAPVADDDSIEWTPFAVVAPAVALVAVLALVAPPLAGGGKVPLLPATADRSYVPGWAAWNYRGYEDKPSYPEYREVVSTMARVGREEGCGRAMWEYEKELDRYGTPMALMLLPYWTDGCIGSMEGLFFESSATTPYHFLNQSELSRAPSCAQRDLPYRNCSGQLTPQVDDGVAHLQLMGVRYYMALSDEAKAQAARNPDLRKVASTRPFTVGYSENNTTVDKVRSWDIFEVRGSELVEPLDHLPAVMTEVPKGGKRWQDAAVRWYQDASMWAVPLAASGPSSWPRVPDAHGDPEQIDVDPVKVTGIETSTDRIAFDVSDTGRPVLVKASYFPNWRAEGADGPYRVTPNLMVVVPTSRHVELEYAATPVDIGSWILTALGVAGVVALWRAGPVLFRRPEPTDDPAFEPHEVAGGSPVAERHDGSAGDPRGPSAPAVADA